MQAGGVKSAADVGDVGERVQVAEHADAIDEHDVGVGAAGSSRRAVLSAALCPLAIGATCCAVGSCGAMISRRSGIARAQRLERGEKHRLVRRPRRTGDERRARRAEAREQRAGAIDALRARATPGRSACRR